MGYVDRTRHPVRSDVEIETECHSCWWYGTRKCRAQDARPISRNILHEG